MKIGVYKYEIMHYVNLFIHLLVLLALAGQIFPPNTEDTIKNSRSVGQFCAFIFPAEFWKPSRASMLEVGLLRGFWQVAPPTAVVQRSPFWVWGSPVGGEVGILDLEVQPHCVCVQTLGIFIVGPLPVLPRLRAHLKHQWNWSIHWILWWVPQFTARNRLYS
jgi:hypothetical protein